MAIPSERFAGLVRGIPDSSYHADGNTLSSTGARKLLALPARYRYERDNPPGSSKAFDFGHLAHRLILGEGGDIVVVEADNWMSKAAKEARDIARLAGKIPCLRAEHQAAQDMVDAVMANTTAAELLADGEAELSGYWRDEPTGVGLRFRADLMTTLDTRTVCVDVKTTVSADPAEFGRSVAKFGYHLQAFWYLRGLAAHGIDDARFLFLCIEKSPPYPVSVIELDDEALAEGGRLMRKAIDLFARCCDTGQWPGYGDLIHTVSLPHWALREANDEAAKQLINELKGITA